MALTSLLLPACKNDKPVINNRGLVPQVMEVKGVVAVPQIFNNTIFSTGTLLANEEVELRPEVAGRITSINFQEGSHVTKGELLVKINDADLQAQLKKLLLDEKLALEDLYRKEHLLEIKAVSQEEFDIAQNQLLVIQAEIDLIRAQIAKTEIFAPFTGQVGLRFISPGGYVSSSMLIARIQQTDPIKIEFTVPEKYTGYIKKGMDIGFTVAGSDSSFTGTVYAMEPCIDLSTRSFTVRARCPNPDHILVPGAFTKVKVILESISDALVLPAEALIPDIRGEKVLLYRHGKVQTVYIVPGIRTDNEVEVSEGLNPYDTIITTGLLQLRDGMDVKVRLQDSQQPSKNL